MIRTNLLLAQTPYQNRLQGLRGAFNQRQNDPTDVTGILIFFAAVALLIVALVLVKRFRARKEGRFAPRHPLRLFTLVLKKMGVGLTDRILMRSLARAARLPQPTLMFFSPSLYERHARRAADAIAVKALRAHARRRVEAIGRKAFTAAEDQRSVVRVESESGGTGIPPV